MTRAPLTLGHLACCLPLQPLHTVSACVYVHVCHRQQPLTRNAALRQKGITERGGGRGKIWGKQGRTKKIDGGPEHARVKRLCHECDEVIDGKGLCAKEHHPLFTLSSLSTSTSPSFSRLISVRFLENPLGLTQVISLNRSRQRPTS